MATSNGSTGSHRRTRAQAQQHSQATPQQISQRGYIPQPSDYEAYYARPYQAEQGPLRSTYQKTGKQPEVVQRSRKGGSRGGHTANYTAVRHGGSKQGPPWRTLLVIMAALVLIGGIAFAATRGVQSYQDNSYVSAYDGVFCEGVYVDGIHLGGMTVEEGVTAVTSQAEQANSEWSVNLTYSGQVVTTITAGQLGMTVDVVDVMQEAWQQGHEGNTAQRKAAMEQLLVEPYQGYTAVPSGDNSIVDNILGQIQSQLYAPATDAALLSFDPTLSYPFTFREEVPGRTLNIEPLKQKLYRMVSTMTSGDIEIVPDVIQPTVTVEGLKQHYAMRSSVYTPISTRSTEERNNNIRHSFEYINGYVLQPGKSFSFNGIVGKRTTKNGFYEAIEYAYGAEVMGVGGGVCQASTTVYQAAVTAGLEITHREPHSDAVSYTSYGQDATVYWEGKRKIDLTFRNNTDMPLYFIAAVETDPANRKRLIARVTIYGESLGDVRYELTSETVAVLDPPEEPKYIKDKNQEYVTYTDQEKVIAKAKEGYVVDSYRLKYVNGELTERTKLYTDRYEPKQEQIYVGTKTRD